MSHVHVPSSILILGSGVFGLSTLHALLRSPRYTTTHITLISPHPLVTYTKAIEDTSSTTEINDSIRLPNDSQQSTASHSHYHGARHTASHDTSRIVRADYASLPYARLVARAQQQWRHDSLFKAHYHESGLVIVGGEYAKSAQQNVEKLSNDGANIEVLKDEVDFRRILGIGGGGKGVDGEEGGYVNWSSGWADASGAIKSLAEEVYQLTKSRKNIRLITGWATKLIFDRELHDFNGKPYVLGVHLGDSKQIHASLTIVAMGAWSPSLGGLDLRGRAEASGQCIAYIQLSPSEISTYAKMPSLINMASGIYIISPDRLGRIKIAQHGFGYRNPVYKTYPNLEENSTVISAPSPDYTTLPRPALSTLRHGLQSTLPALSSHPFSETRMCWYTDTPKGDFLVDYHPDIEGLFVATGGSGHAFKFLPVLGEAVVGVLERRESELRELWRWKDVAAKTAAKMVGESNGEGKGGRWLWTMDGSRGGRIGMVLEEEMRREEGRESKL